MRKSMFSRQMLKVTTQRNPFERAASFSLGHRLYRLTWKLTWLVLARWTPSQFHRWRVFLVNCFGAQVHSSAALYPSVEIWYPANLIMGARATLGPRVNCYSMGKISIGEAAVISQGAFLCTGTHDIHRPEFQIMARPIEIGSQCWICAEAFVGPGVKVGEGAVLAARGAAFRDLNDWCVYVGNPAVMKAARCWP